MAKMKLTNPQIKVLRDLSLGPSTFSDSYPPVRSLLKREFITEKAGRWSSSYVITDLGRAALSQASRGQTEEG